MDEDIQHLLEQLDEIDENKQEEPELETELELEEGNNIGVVSIKGTIDDYELTGGPQIDEEETDGEPVKVIGDKSGEFIEYPENIENIGGNSSVALVNMVDEQPVVTNQPPDSSKYLAKLDSVTDEILEACRSDRQEAQDVIQMLRVEIQKALGLNRDPSRMFVDGLVKAVEVKANINMTAVKVMEANAKMLASLKAGTNVQVNNQNVNLNGNDVDLERVLNEPMTSEDEF